MKNTKKLAGLLLAVVMVMSMATAIFAADPATYTITINNATEGHTYEAYQIFKGDLSESTLSNIEWGNGVNSEALLTALKSDATIGSAFTDCTNAAMVAKALEGKGNDTDFMKAFAQIVGDHLTTSAGTSAFADSKYTITGLSAGYYLVKDTGAITGHDTYTRFILEVVKDVTVTHKGTVPSVEKTVEEKNDTTDTTSTGDAADYDIGDEIKFTLTGTLPSNYADYETYKYVFHDTLSAGLTYKANSVKVYIDADGGTDITDNFTVEANGTTLNISCNDLKAITELTANNEIVVTYTATLNENAVVGNSGNINTVKVEFSNDPNFDGTGTPPTGNTPEDTVVVFTYKTIINKVDEGNNALTGAAFKLEKLVGTEWKTVKEITTGSTFEFSGLDAGKYRLTETVTPAGYNTIAPIEFEITAANDGNVITSLTGTATELTFTSNVTDGSLTADVVNKAGSLLPSTGGIGTTIFYTVGAILVIGAVVLLVTKRRVGAAR